MFSLVWFLFASLLIAQNESPSPEPSPTPTTEISQSPTPTQIPISTSTPTQTPKPFANIRSLPASATQSETFTANIVLENLSVGRTYYIKFFSVSSISSFDTLNGNNWLSGTTAWSSFPYLVSTSQTQETSIQARSTQSGAFNDLKIRLRESNTNYDSTTQSSLVIYEPTPTPTSVQLPTPIATPSPTTTPTPFPTNLPTATPTLAPTGFVPTIIPTQIIEPTPDDTIPTEIQAAPLDDPTPTNIGPELTPAENSSSDSGEVLGSAESNNSISTTNNILPVLLIAGGGLVFLTPLFISFFKK